MLLGYKPVQHVTVLNTVGNCNTVVRIILYYNSMGQPSYMRSVVDRNVVMWRIPAHINFKLEVLSYGMWRRVTWYVPTFQEDHISYITRVIHLLPMMQAAVYSNTGLYNYKTTRRYIPENILIRSLRPSFLKFWHMKLTRDSKISLYTSQQLTLFRYDMQKKAKEWKATRLFVSYVNNQSVYKLTRNINQDTQI
jgi:hypothetical protein